MSLCLYLIKQVKFLQLLADVDLLYFHRGQPQHRELHALSCSATKNDQNAKNVSIITVCHMGSKLPSHGSKDVFCSNVLPLLRRATRTSSVIEFAAGYFLILVILY